MSEEQQAQPQFALQRIYIKDASMESPNAPQAFLKPWEPEINLDMNSDVTPLDETNFEVVLTLTVTAKNDGETAFLVELQQAGIFSISGLDEQELHHTLGAFCPNILFPYARETVDTMVTKASFPPLMLAPVNFDALYAQQLEQRAEAAKSEEATAH